MDKAITTALLIVAGVVCMIFVFNSVYPMINRSNQAMVSMAETIDERMKSRINIVHAANSANRTSVYLWIKNVGTQRITAVDESDLFFGQSFSQRNLDRTIEWQFTAVDSVQRTDGCTHGIIGF